jgi:hypothetical protein
MFASKQRCVLPLRQGLCASASLVIVGLLLFVSPDSSAQEVPSTTGLKVSPDESAKAAGTIQAKSPVKILQRQGFWVEVEAKGARGWLKASAITFGSPGPGLAGLASGREGKGNIVSTSAARGLSSKELVAAKPNLSQVDALDRLAVDSTASEAFATSGKLARRTVSMLAAPVKTSEKPSGKPKKRATLEDEDDDE